MENPKVIYPQSQHLTGGITVLCLVLSYVTKWNEGHAGEWDLWLGVHCSINLGITVSPKEHFVYRVWLKKKLNVGRFFNVKKKISLKNKQ